MSDLESFYKENSGFIPAVMDTDDLRNWTTDCVCTVCKKRKVGSGEAVTSRFDDYNGIPLDCGELTAHQYLLCPFEIKAFVFATRTWRK